MICAKYGIKIDHDLHQEILQRYKRLGIAPYKGFLNPWLKPVRNHNGEIVDVEVDYSETLEQQMMRYSRDYSFEDI